LCKWNTEQVDDHDRDQRCEKPGEHEVAGKYLRLECDFEDDRATATLLHSRTIRGAIRARPVWRACLTKSSSERWTNSEISNAEVDPDRKSWGRLVRQSLHTRLISGSPAISALRASMELALFPCWALQASRQKTNIIADVDKLTIYNTTTSAPGYLLPFGQSGYLKVVEPNSEQSFKSRGKLVSWEAGRTKYSAQALPRKVVILPVRMSAEPTHQRPSTAATMEIPSVMRTDSRCGSNSTSRSRAVRQAERRMNWRARRPGACANRRHRGDRPIF